MAKQGHRRPKRRYRHRPFSVPVRILLESKGVSLPALRSAMKRIAFMADPDGRRRYLADVRERQARELGVISR